jgi:tRNA threonylcarbamoyladenosine biosynthesis protein TsaE
MSATRTVYLDDPAATDALAEALAGTMPARAMVALHGDLGAGKSSLARAWLRALGVEGAIRSPTYTLVERYRLADGRSALHLDLYRIGDAGELEFLALDADDIALWLVEWPERGAGALPPTDLEVRMALEGRGRRVALVPTSEAGHDWLARLASVQELDLHDVLRSS